MDKTEVANVLDEIGTLLELQGENAFRCNAYHNAARAIQQLETNIADVVEQQAGRTPAAERRDLSARPWSAPRPEPPATEHPASRGSYRTRAACARWAA